MVQYRCFFITEHPRGITGLWAVIYSSLGNMKKFSLSRAQSWEERRIGEKDEVAAPVSLIPWHSVLSVGPYHDSLHSKEPAKNSK